MDDAMVNEARGCDPSPDDGSPSDCGSPLALPFFISFMVIGSFVFLNLVVAVILDNFTALGNVNPELVSAADISNFKDEWSRLDPDADGLIPAKHLPDLVMSLRTPLGLHGTELLDGPNPRSKALRFCLSLGLRQRESQLAFRVVLDALITKNYAAKRIIETEVPRKDSQNVPEVLTPKRRESAAVYAEEIIGMYLQGRRAQSPDGSPLGRRASKSVPVDPDVPSRSLSAAVTTLPSAPSPPLSAAAATLTNGQNCSPTRRMVSPPVAQPQLRCPPPSGARRSRNGENPVRRRDHSASPAGPSAKRKLPAPAAMPPPV